MLFRFGESSIRRNKASYVSKLHKEVPDTFPKDGTNEDVSVQNQ